MNEYEVRALQQQVQNLQEDYEDLMKRYKALRRITADDTYAFATVKDALRVLLDVIS